MKGPFPIQLLFFTAFVFFYVSCNDTVCSYFNTETVIIRFYDQETQEPKTFHAQFISAVAIDSILFEGDSLVSFALPVNPAIDSTIFYFINDSNTEILTVKYTQQQRLISEECGYEVIIGNIMPGFSTFPQVVGLKNELSTLNAVNVEVYF